MNREERLARKELVRRIDARNSAIWAAIRAFDAAPSKEGQRAIRRTMKLIPLRPSEKFITLPKKTQREIIRAFGAAAHRVAQSRESVRAMALRMLPEDAALLLAM